MRFAFKLMAACTLAAIFAASCKEAPKELDLKHQIGLQLYSIRGEMANDVAGSIQKVGAMGYNTVEMANYNNEEGTFYGMPAADFAALCAENGLKCISSHVGGPNPAEVSMDDCIAWWKKAIADHKAAGCQYIVVPGMARAAYDSIPGLQAYCDLFNQVGALCAAEGMKFGYHNHSGEFTTVFETPEDTVRMYDYMMNNTDPEKVFFELDLYWIAQGGCDAIEYFNKYPGRFKGYHVKDRLEVGASGEIDFASLYAQADVAGMEFQIIEQEAFAEGLTPFESIKISLDNARAAQAKADAGYCVECKKECCGECEGECKGECAKDSEAK